MSDDKKAPGDPETKTTSFSSQRERTEESARNGAVSEGQSEANSATTQNFLASLTVRLDAELRRGDHLSRLNHELEARIAALENHVRNVDGWRHHTAHHVDVFRRSMSWKLMRMISRFGALVVRGEDEGRSGFLRWGVSRITRSGYPLKRTFDPLADLFNAAPPLYSPPPPLASEYSSSPLTVVPPPGATDPSVFQSAVSEPVVRREGRLASGSVDIVIPVKGSVNWLAECLRYLHSSEPVSLIARVIVVDDGSDIDERAVLDTLARRYPALSIVENVSPKGFAGACNAGARVGDAPYILFLNSDCLLAPTTLESMVRACSEDSSVGMVSALSNNAGTLSVPLPTGMSFIQVNDRLKAAFGSEPAETRITEACTVVGHCLLVTRTCFNAVEGFDTSWGLGYGEETDLQMRAMNLGYRGVTPLDTYVYHFGGGTFKYEATRASLQRENHARFLQVWGDEYRALMARCQGRDPVALAVEALAQSESEIARPDVLFVLPGMRHGVGGCMVVLDLCNHLISHGVDAKAIILGDVDREIMRDYPEALYFSPFFAKNQHALFELSTTLRPKVVVGTLFTTVFPGRSFAALCGATFVNYVQGYEFYFDNGIHYGAVREAYRMSDICLATSDWLAQGIERHSPDSKSYLLPLGVDRHTMFPAVSAEITKRKTRIGVVIRHSPDKGQWILREVVDRLALRESELSLTLFCTPSDIAGLNEAWSSSSDIRHVVLPLDRYRMAHFLRECDIVIDASLHEGFGLVPLEAMASGATVVASDSGGVRQFLRNGENGFLIERSTSPDAFVEAIDALVRSPELLQSFRAAALRTAAEFDREVCFDRYKAFFEAIASGDLGRCEEFASRGGVTKPLGVAA